MAAALVCTFQQPSEAQREYQSARLAAGAVLPSNIFYKDATPRVAHFLSCELRLVGRERFPAKPLPLELTLVYDDGTPTSETDQASLRILSLSSHVKAAIPADGDSVVVSYRIELGSFRRADRSFALKAELALEKPPAGGGGGGGGEKVEPCVTPAVYVLSKKKLEQQKPTAAGKRRMVDAFPGDDEDSEDSHRHHFEGRRASPPGGPSDPSRAVDRADETILRRLYALETRVQELTNVIQSVLPHVQAAIQPQLQQQPQQQYAIPQQQQQQQQPQQQQPQHHHHPQQQQQHQQQQQPQVQQHAATNNGQYATNNGQHDNGPIRFPGAAAPQNYDHRNTMVVSH
eukprot:CAMPEP_0118893690 /NCGR_PEP_ID=MMETSP1166-20130328/2797_1 /TAXON_ID=1104430 /ORGANISM="Chrysoreinhardia sp, Strain CCMP3193" /LENGTH=343 /DNA_ID=CAMNT_0006832531 /DNA_START=105 /DNA_END=1136 /DNA_ORIENTATION=+